MEIWSARWVDDHLGPANPIAVGQTRSNPARPPQEAEDRLSEHGGFSKACGKRLRDAHLAIRLRAEQLTKKRAVVDGAHGCLQTAFTRPSESRARRSSWLRLDALPWRYRSEFR